LLQQTDQFLVHRAGIQAHRPQIQIQVSGNQFPQYGFAVPQRQIERAVGELERPQAGFPY
jgi:hypothetical protein